MIWPKDPKFFHDGKNYGKLFSKTTSCYDQESIATEVHNFFPLSFFFFLGNTFLSGIMEIGQKTAQQNYKNQDDLGKQT